MYNTAVYIADCLTNHAPMLEERSHEYEKKKEAKLDRKKQQGWMEPRAQKVPCTI